jgi:hypothetical protein
VLEILGGSSYECYPGSGKAGLLQEACKKEERKDALEVERNRTSGVKLVPRVLRRKHSKNV